MIVAHSAGATNLTAILVYLLVCGYLGWLGYRRTQTAADYLLAGRRAHPFVMALSYGATFISTSAIVGFGGVAGTVGLSLHWLTFLNISVGIFLAFVVLGAPTRRLSRDLDAHTFPELLGRRYGSKSIQVFAGLVIFIFMPLYTAAVLIGGAEFLAQQFDVRYDAAILLFAVTVLAYVLAGGLKAVMYTDALQGCIMLVGMIVLLCASYNAVGGVRQGHEDLTAMASTPTLLGSIGHRGWTAMPRLGWGAEEYNLGWTVMSTIVLGVGVGVLAQPQLVVRFMTVRSKRELNRAVAVGGVFILCMTGVAYSVGALSNVYFYRHETIVGRRVGDIETVKILVKRERGLSSRIPCRLIHIDTDGDGRPEVDLITEGVGVPYSTLMPAAEVTDLGDGRVQVKPRATSFTRAVVWSGKEWILNVDSILPIFIGSALPRWFGPIFLLTVLAAAMSTLSSQLHTLGAGIGRDVYGTLKGGQSDGLGLTRTGIMIGLLVAVLVSYFARGGYIIARATAIFFGLCASTFLPAYVGGLFLRRVTRAGAMASMIVGFATTAFWILFVKETESRALGVCELIFGRNSLLEGRHNWPVVDPLVVALPLSILALFVGSVATGRRGRR
jgi:SSS family solute:Na+ symporter